MEIESNKNDGETNLSDSQLFNQVENPAQATLVVDGLDLVSFIKEKKLTKVRKGTYELLNRKGDGRISGTLAKLRDKVDEFAKVTDDDIEKALSIASGVSGRLGGASDSDVYLPIKKFITDFDVISIASENKYYIWEDALEHSFDFSGLRKKFKALRTSEGNTVLDDILEEEKKVYNARDFSAREENLPPSVYNTVSLIHNGIQRFNILEQGECNPVLDCLFDTVSGMCPVSKTVLEKSFVMMYMNTLNKRLQNRPPIFILFGAGGTGKTRLFSNFANILLGRKVCTVVGVSTANSNFNGFMVGKRVVVFNEMKGVQREKLTEAIKSYTDDMLPIQEKGREARDVENVAMIAVTSNGYEGSIIAEGDGGGVDRRYQFIEGKTTFKEEALKRGLIAPLQNKIKTPAGDAELEMSASVLLSGALCDETVIKHMQFLINKYYDELENDHWRVTAIKTPAYDVYLKRQAPAWVTKFIDWVRDNVKPGKHCTPKALYENYVALWATEKSLMKFETFIEKVSNHIDGHPDLKGKYKFTSEAKPVRYKDGLKKVNGVYITDEAWDKIKENIDYDSALASVVELDYLDSTNTVGVCTDWKF